MDPGGMEGDGMGGDHAGAGDRARLVCTIRTMKITSSVASPASMSSTPIRMGPRMPPAMLSPNARLLPAGTPAAPGVSTVNRPGRVTCKVRTAMP